MIYVQMLNILRATTALQTALFEYAQKDINDARAFVEIQRCTDELVKDVKRFKKEQS